MVFATHLVKSHVRYLKLLSVTSNSYGTLLTLVLLSRLPDELQLLISWNIGGNNWTLDALMTHVEKEIKAREQATAAMTGHGNTKKSTIKEPLTAAALLTRASEHSPNCSYCCQPHSLNLCSPSFSCEVFFPVVSPSHL